MYLDLFVKNLFPPWNEIFVIAAKIMQDLSVNDPDFYQHLSMISVINPRVNPRVIKFCKSYMFKSNKQNFLIIKQNRKDFVSEIIYNESKRALKLKNATTGDAGAYVKGNKEILTEPVIFIRKWIGEAFSGALSKNALLYVWDQLFMSLWSPREFEMIAKCLLYLLRLQFMKAQDHDEMRRVLNLTKSGFSQKFCCLLIFFTYRFSLRNLLGFSPLTYKARICI
jgi:hypothetical protein